MTEETTDSWNNEPTGDRIADKLIEQGYGREEIEALVHWVRLSSLLCLNLNEDMLEALKKTVHSLTLKAEKLYAELMTGETDQIAMTVQDLGEDWPFDKKASLSDLFLELTGTLLFKGVDGPRATETALGVALDQMMSDLREDPELRGEISRIAEKHIDPDVLTQIRGQGSPE